MGFTSDEDIFSARIEDAFRLCVQRNQPRFVGFLNERERLSAEAVVRRHPECRAVFWGGYEQAQRTMLCVLPDYLPQDGTSAPITALGFHFRTQAALTHRDFLGTMMACGIRRECVGDILCTSGLAVAFVETAMADFLQENITKVGGEGVRIEYPFTGELPSVGGTEDRRDTVASSRLDSVLRVMLRTSRTEAARRIAAGAVSVNHTECLDADRILSDGDIVSVRGSGRFRIKIGDVTKKGRLSVTVQKFI